MIVYVAIINLRYDVIAVANTHAEAVALASTRALEFLVDAGAAVTALDTPEKVVEYFGVTVTPINVGGAVVI